MQRFVRVVSKDLFILVRKIINCDIRNIFICWYGLMNSYCFEGRNGRTLVICTKLNGSYREICLPREVINIYPKHCEWVENYAFVNSLSGVYMTVNPKVNSMQKFISRCGYAKCGETDDGDYVFKRIFSS